MPISGEDTKKLSFKERFGKKAVVQEKKEMKNNIISVNLLKTKANSNVYGIDKILKTTLYFLKKYNPLDKKNFEELENIKNDLEKIDIEKDNNEQRTQLEKKANDFFQEISKDNSLLSGCKNIFNILEKAKYEANFYFYSGSFYYFIFLRFLTKIVRIKQYISVFKKIENCYKIFTDEVSIIPLISKNEDKDVFEFNGFQILEHLNKNKNQLSEEKKNLLKEFENSSNITINEIELHVKGKIMYLKDLPYKSWFHNIILYFSDPLLRYFKEYLIDYFEEYIKKQCCIDYILRQKLIYSNIFDQIEEMSKKNDWDKFHIQII